MDDSQRGKGSPQPKKGKTAVNSAETAPSSPNHIYNKLKNRKLTEFETKQGVTCLMILCRENPLAINSNELELKDLIEKDGGKCTHTGRTALEELFRS